MIRLSLQHKLGFIAGILVLLLGLGGAAEVSVNQTTTELEPGTNQTLGQLTVSSETNDTEILDTTHNFPFPVWLVNQSRTTTAANNTTHTQLSADILVRPPHDFEPGNRSNTFYLILPAESHQIQFDYAIREIRNWSVTPTNLTQNVSVGSNGLFGTLAVHQDGNADQTITTNVTGNLSPFLRVEPSFSVHPDTPHEARLTFQVPESTRFGNYSGRLLLTSGEDETRVNLSAVFLDQISPTIQTMELPESVMATQPAPWLLEISDNLAVDQVTANVSKVITVTEGNDTVRTNTSVTSVEFTHEANTDEWTAEFTDTADITQYYANLSITDTAGNTVHRMHAFTVAGLSAVDITQSNFQFTSIRHKEQATDQILTNSVDSPFSLQLDRFEYAGNASVQVGVLAPDESTPEYFDATGSSIEFTQPGEYQLVVDSREEESASGVYRFDGRLTVSVPDQHENVSDIVFGGQINSDEYPEPRELRIDEFEGFIGYDNVLEEFEARFGPVGSDGSRTYTYFLGRVPAENCRGFANWDGCRTISLGELERELDAADTAQTQRDLAVGLAIVAVLAAVVFTYCYTQIVRHRGAIMAYHPRKRE
ncbi:hypothetical protein [Halorarum salinum]|uniref:Uncharacterized protein n=1 Tax=Halorarum salinum TaxID=2743089 RepID=A0A7D5QG55_9EURY|nr:hypothetical protein [Halobaculum salinum]QLG61963.1 hypothetical protein HUG12_09620 [Halobaculum salinum]